MTKIKPRLTFGEYACAFPNKINVQIFRSLSSYSRKRLSNILVQSIKFAIFAEDRLINDEIASWVLEVLEHLCVDENEEQSLLHYIPSKDEMWPVFVAPNFSLTKVT